MFTLVAFLFPTVLAYYSLFALVRIFLLHQFNLNDARIDALCDYSDSGMFRDAVGVYESLSVVRADVAGEGSLEVAWFVFL